MPASSTAVNTRSQVASYHPTSHLTMSQSPEISYSLGSPPPTIACPHCPRHFKTKSGRTRHIQAKHSAENAPAHPPHPSSPAATVPTFHDPSLSPIPSHLRVSPSMPPSFDGLNADHDVDIVLPPQPSFHDPSPVLSHFTQSIPPFTGFNADDAMDIAPPTMLSSPQLSYRDPSPVPSHVAPSIPPSFAGFNTDDDMDIAPPMLSSPQLSYRDPSPVPSHFAPSIPPSFNGFNANDDLGIAPPMLVSSPQLSYHDPSPVPSHFAPSIPPSHDQSIDTASKSPSLSQPSSLDISPFPSPIPDTSRLTRAFHPKLNGM